jgi:hypothetical protein
LRHAFSRNYKIAEIQHDCSFKVFQLFAESIGGPGQAAAVHGLRAGMPAPD